MVSGRMSTRITQGSKWTHITSSLRAQANSTLQSVSSRPDQDPDHRERPYERRKFKLRLPANDSSRSVFISSWDGISSMVDAYAIIRGVERKYGRIREFRFMRDYEMSQNYQSYLLATFRSEDALEYLAEGATLHIPAPPHDVNRPGGVGLDDIQGLLQPQEKVVDAELPGWGSVMSRVIETKEEIEKNKDQRILDVRVERAREDFVYPSQLIREDTTRNRKFAAGRAFLSWGGFSDLQPLTSSPFISPMSDSGPSQAPTIDHPRMRAALTKWSELSGQPDPSIAMPEYRDEPGGEVLDASSSVESTAAPETVPSDESVQAKEQEHEAVEWEPLVDLPEPPPSEVEDEVLSDSSAPSIKPPKKTKRERRVIRKAAKESGREREAVSDMNEIGEKVGLRDKVKSLFGGWL